MNSEHTPLQRIRHPSFSDLDLRVKDESYNPFGTHKDRRSASIVQQALLENIDTLALVTAGNAGYSLARMAENSGIRVVAIVGKGVTENIRNALRSSQADMIETDLKVRLSSKGIRDLVRWDEERIWDVTNGFEAAYKSIACELQGENPQAIVVPVGSGELYLGMRQGMRECGMQARLIGVGVRDLHSQADKLSAAWTPKREKIEQLAGGDLLYLTEEEVQWCIDNAPEGLRAEPSALVVFGAVRRLREELKDVIVVNTGKGLL